MKHSPITPTRLRRDCWHCEGIGSFSDRFDPYARSRECEDCDGEGEVDARCDAPGCRQYAVTGIDNEFWCAEHDANAEDISLAPVTVSEIGDGWKRAAA